MKQIHGFPDYFADEEGHIYSPFNKRRPKELGMLRRLKCTVRPDGYVAVTLRRGNKVFTAKVHRLILLTFLGEPLFGQECRHLDGNRQNNRLSNLTWGTKKENSQDTIRHGRSMRGERNFRTTLKESEVLNIIKSDQPRREIAKIYGVSKVTICRIKNGKRWGHLHRPNYFK